MTAMKGASFFVALALLCGVSLAQLHTYQEKCDVGLTSDNRQVDTCDTQKFLKCRDSRCQCADAANQIWTYTLVPVNSRKRRGKGGRGGGKGFGKGIAIGAGAGAIGGFVAGRATAGSGSSSSSSGGSSSGRSVKKTKQYSCYSRVGGSCMLNNPGGSSIISVIKIQEATTTTTTTTTAAPAPAGNDSSTTTTSTAAPAPVAAAQSSQITYDVFLPKCVENAVCRPIQVKIVNGTVISGGAAGDPRIGACQCADGYKANSQDVCVRTNGVGKQSEAAFFLTVACLLISFLYKN